MWKSLEEIHLFLPRDPRARCLAHAGEKSPLQKPSLTHTWAGEAKLDNTGEECPASTYYVPGMNWTPLVSSLSVLMMAL